MDPEQKSAFDKLLAAEDVYIKAHISEVYQAGTIHYIRTLRSQTILKDLFQVELRHLERQKWPPLSGQEVGSADAWLNREYEAKLQELRKHTEDETRYGAVAPERLASVEKSWQAYRDTWLAFALLRYPAEVNVIRAEITLDRYRLLKTMQ